MPPLSTAAIPQELKERSQWVCWKIEIREDKETKIPYQPNERHAKTNDPATWTSFETVCQALEDENGFDGVGFVFSDLDDYAGLDFDNCVDPIKGEIIDPQVKRWVRDLDSYTEYSQSRSGLHVIVKGQIPGPHKRQDNVEMYHTGRYFCMTGQRYDGTPAKIESRQDALNELYSKLFGALEAPPRANTPEVPNEIRGPTCQLKDSDVIQKATTAQNRDKFVRLFYDGDTSDYRSQSEADLALCGILCFWCCNRAQIDRIFRRSGLYRSKWDERRGDDTYSNNTIQKAIAEGGETYGSFSEAAAEALCSQNSSTAVVLSERINDGLYCVHDPDNPCLSGDGVKEHTLKVIDNRSEKETDVPIVTGYKMTGSGNSLRLITYFGNSVRYSNQLKCWFIYDGTRWARDEQLKITELAKQTADRIHAEVAFLERDDLKEERKAREELAKWALKSESRYNLEEMVALARSDVRVRISPEELDARPELINFPNGTLDLEKREFREHRREDMLSKMTKVPYDPTHSSKYFYPTLQNAMPADVVVYLQRVLGSFLEYTTQNKEILILYGAPYAGKSSITQAVYNALGDYAAAFPKELLQKSRHGIAANAARPELMALEGVRIAWTEETNQDMIFDEAMFRSITSSGIKSARNLFERQRQIHLGASFIIETNAPPTIDVTDENSRNAMLDRILVAPFLKTIPKEKRDKKVLRRLTHDPDELMVAIAWLVQGYFERKDYGL